MSLEIKIQKFDPGSLVCFNYGKFILARKEGVPNELEFYSHPLNLDLKYHREIGQKYAVLEKNILGGGELVCEKNSNALIELIFNGFSTEFGGVPKGITDRLFYFLDKYLNTFDFLKAEEVRYKDSFAKKLKQWEKRRTTISDENNRLIGIYFHEKEQLDTEYLAKKNRVITKFFSFLQGVSKEEYLGKNPALELKFPVLLKEPPQLHYDFIFSGQKKDDFILINRCLGGPFSRRQMNMWVKYVSAL